MHPAFRAGLRVAAASALAGVAAIPLAGSFAPLTAQRAVTAPATYAITDARIVPVSGAPIEKGTIVIRNGIITAVGANARVPADARVVDGTGLTVYPGFIDAYGTLGLRAGAAPAGPGGGGGGGFGGGAAAALPGAANSRAAVGFRPEVRAVDQLSDSADFAAANAAGFTTALTAPAGRVFEGQSALINLRAGAYDFGERTLKPTVTLNVGFQGIGGGQFPSSLLGVLSGIRQSLYDAQNYRDRMAAYTRNPRGTARPPYDPSMEALQPVIAGQMPMVFRASTQREIERALSIAEEFKIKVIIAGGADAYLVTDRLKAANAAVLLSANFPRVTAAPAADAEPEPVRVLRDRVQAPKTAGQLHAAGVRFALQSGGGHAEFLANLRRAVKGGLAPDAALRALTLGTAELFGVQDRVGSIEVGKIANLTVVRGDVFADTSRVAAVYVDGRPTEFRAPAAAAGGQRPGAAPQRPGEALVGQWALTAEVDGVEHYATVQLRADDELVRGTLQGDLGVAEISDVRFDDDEVSFSATVTLPEGTEEAWFRGTLTDGVFTGRVEILGHATGRFGAFRTTSTQER